MAGKANVIRDGSIFRRRGLKHVILIQKTDKCEEQKGMAEEQQKQSGGSVGLSAGVMGRGEEERG